LKAGGFSASLDVLHGGQGINKQQFSIKKRRFFSCIILQVLVIKFKTLDPDPDPH